MVRNGPVVSLFWISEKKMFRPHPHWKRWLSLPWLKSFAQLLPFFAFFMCLERQAFQLEQKLLCFMRPQLLLKKLRAPFPRWKISRVPKANPQLTRKTCVSLSVPNFEGWNINQNWAESTCSARDKGTQVCLRGGGCSWSGYLTSGRNVPARLLLRVEHSGVCHPWCKPFGLRGFTGASRFQTPTSFKSLPAMNNSSFRKTCHLERTRLWLHTGHYYSWHQIHNQSHSIRNQAVCVWSLAFIFTCHDSYISVSDSPSPWRQRCHLRAFQARKYRH